MNLFLIFQIRSNSGFPEQLAAMKTTQSPNPPNQTAWNKRRKKLRWRVCHVIRIVIGLVNQYGKVWVGRLYRGGAMNNNNTVLSSWWLLVYGLV